MLLADTLSRAYLPESTKGDSETELETDREFPGWDGVQRRKSSDT